MSTVRVFADGDAASGARLDQTVDLYRGLGLAVDLMVVSNGRLDPAPPACLARCRAAGVVDRARFRQGDWPTVSADGVTVVHFGPGVPRGRTPVGDALRIVDLGAGNWEGDTGERTGRGDLILAIAEDARRRAGHMSGATAVRLPPRPEKDDRPLPLPRPYLGWVGGVDDALAEAWSSLFQAIGEHAVLPAQPFLLAGPGAGKVLAPPELGPILRVADTAQENAARAAMALALLPGPGPDHHSDVATLLEHDVPVLTTAAVAQGFEDRWQLPAFDDHHAMAAALARMWQCHDPLDLTECTARTRTAWRQDLAAMTEHVARHIADRLVTR